MAITRETFEYIWGNAHSYERTVTPEGAAAITRWEKFVPTWYADGFWKSGQLKGQIKWSIGFGHQEGGENWPFDRAEEPDLRLTREQGNEIFRRDVEAKARFVRNKINPDIWLTQPMFNGVVSLVFNAGEGNVEKGRVLKLFNDGMYAAAIAAFHDHRFAWEFEKDAAGNKIPDPDKPGEFMKKLVEKNGLIVRRGSEMGICMTYVGKE